MSTLYFAFIDYTLECPRTWIWIQFNHPVVRDLRSEDRLYISLSSLPYLQNNTKIQIQNNCSGRESGKYKAYATTPFVNETKKRIHRGGDNKGTKAPLSKQWNWRDCHVIISSSAYACIYVWNIIRFFLFFTHQLNPPNVSKLDRDLP